MKLEKSARNSFIPEGKGLFCENLRLAPHGAVKYERLHSRLQMFYSVQCASIQKIVSSIEKEIENSLEYLIQRKLHPVLDEPGLP